MEKEIWKDIPNYYGYQVSNLGNVRTYDKKTFTERHGERHWANRTLKQKCSTNKYGRKDARVELWNGGKHKTILVARLVATTFYDIPLNSKLTVNHKDGNSLNNNIKNLEMISLKDNIQHAYRNGLYKNKFRIEIINKVNGLILIAPSLSIGSISIGKSHGYLSERIKKEIYEDDKYIWKLI